MSTIITPIAVDRLLLDHENPRLPASISRDQQSMIDYIAETTSIEELMQAIGENGYFSGEPLIAVPNKDMLDTFIVVEGNRRLTALKLLKNPNLCSKPSGRMISISNAAKYIPSEAPAVVHENRDDVLPYLGFRHITGVKQWEPLAKARYIEQLFDLTDETFDVKDRYTEVAKTIGSRRDHIKRNLDALAIYKIIETNHFYDIEGLNDESIKFSILSTALADDRIGRFVGIIDDNTSFSEVEPIIDSSDLNIPEIKEITQWIFEKDSKGKTKVGESRNLRFLAAIIDNSKALTAFRSGSPLKIAYQLTEDSTSDFLTLLYSAEASLSEAASMVATIEYSPDAYEISKRILENIKLIGREVKNKRSDDDEF